MDRQYGSQNMELDDIPIDNYDDIEVSSMSEDSDDEQLKRRKSRSSARASSSVMPRGRTYSSTRLDHIPAVPPIPILPSSPKSTGSSIEQAPPSDQVPPGDQATAAPSRNPPFKTDKARNGRRAYLSHWIWELACVLVGIISLTAIALVLYLYEGKSLSDLPQAFTINTILAIFSTTITAALSVPLVHAISQAKWDWFQSGREKPLSDMNAYDKASRGPWGAVQMLRKIRWIHLSSLGAILVMLTLATDFTIQQTISYQARRSTEAFFQNTTSPLFRGYNDTGSIAQRELMRGAIYSAFLRIPPVDCAGVSCPARNCTWQEYDSLAVCSTCTPQKHISEDSGSLNYLKPRSTSSPPKKSSPKKSSPCSADIEGKPVNNVTNDNKPSDCCQRPLTYFEIPDDNKSIIITTSLSIQLERPQNRVCFEDPPQSQRHGTWECALAWCIETIAPGPCSKPRHPDISYAQHNGSFTLTSQRPAAENQSTNITSFLTIDTASSTRISQSIIQVQRSAILLQEFKLNDTELFDNLAKSISAHIRAPPPTANSTNSSGAGRSTLPNTSSDDGYYETVLVVRWVWLTLPIFKLAGTSLFLVAMIILAGSDPVWKASLLPLMMVLNHGPDGAGDESVKGLERIAERWRVRLQRTPGGGWRMVRSSGV